MKNYTTTVNEVFDSLVQSIGIHVTLLVTERALWLTKHKYEEASLITFSESGINLDQLAALDPERSKLIFLSFITNITATLSHLVGKQLAYQLTEELQEAFKEGV